MFTTGVGMPSPFELMIVLAIVMILFGAGKLPKVLGQMGKGVKAFKEGLTNKEGDEGEEPFDVTPDEEMAEAPKAIDEATETAEAGDAEDAEDAEEVVAKDERA
jgi:sec-independent protein translocase protein TatA